MTIRMGGWSAPSYVKNNKLRNRMTLKDEFIMAKQDEGKGRYPASMGRAMATSLAGFLAGLIVGVLAGYIILTLFV